MLTTVQFAALNTFWYLGFADESDTSVRPSCSRVLRAIRAFWPWTSGIVISLATDSGVLLAGPVSDHLDATEGWVTVTFWVTVAGRVDLSGWPPQPVRRAAATAAAAAP